MTKLDQLNQQLHGLSADELRAFESIFIGALSVDTPQAVWDSALAVAAGQIQRDRQRRAS